MHHGDLNPGFVLSLCSLFAVLCSESAASFPARRKYRSTTHRLWKHHELVAVRVAPHHGQQPTAGSPGPRHQPARVPSIGPDDPQPWEPAQQLGQHQLGAVPVLDAGSMNHHIQEQAHGVHYDVAFASGNPFTGIITPRPPFSVVFTDWLSMMAPLGVASRPAASLTRTRNASSTPSHVPLSRHFRKYHQTVPQGGRSWGIRRQGMPPRSTYRCR